MTPAEIAKGCRQIACDVTGPAGLWLGSAADCIDEAERIIRAALADDEAQRALIVELRARVARADAGMEALAAEAKAATERAEDLKRAGLAYHAAERARTRNEDPAAEERLDAEMLEAWLVLRDALDIGDDCEACGAGDGEACAEGCPCRAGGDDQCDACAGGTGNYGEGRANA